MKLIDNLNWRYATKKFDPARKVKGEDLEILKEAIRLSVSSYGLQLYKVLIIENEEVRKELRKASWNQTQITDASHLFVFCNYTRQYEHHVDDYIELISNTQNIDPDGLKGYGNFIKSDISNKSSDQRASWSEKQTYLALSNLLMACAELKIDACPMEGFDSEAYNEILGLSEAGMNAAVISPVGYRSTEDVTQNRKKVRKPKEMLFQMI